MDMLKPANIHKIDAEIESSILSLLTQLVREEIDYKRTVGKTFINDA